jgi:hypothetical protein
VVVTILVIVGVPVVLLAAWVIIHLLMFALYFGDPVRTETPPTGPEAGSSVGAIRDSVATLGFTHGEFYVGIDRRDTGKRQWIGSVDGGVSWVKAHEPRGLSAGAEGDGSWQDCAKDGICYRALLPDWSVGAAPYTPRAGPSGVDRWTPGGGWVTEISRPDGAGFSGLALDPDHSDRAIVMTYHGSTLLLRTAEGTWRQIDILRIADDLRR